MTEISLVGEFHRRQVAAVQDLPREMSGVVPHPGPAGHRADVVPGHGVEPAAQVPLDVVEGEPGRFGEPPVVASEVAVEAVVVRSEYGRGWVSAHVARS